MCDELVRVINGNKMITARGLYKAFNSKERFSKWWNKKIKYIEDGYLKSEFVHPQNKQIISDYLISIKSAKIICQKQRWGGSGVVDVFKRMCNICDEEVTIIETKRDEVVFLESLEKCLEPIGVVGIKQYRVDKYRIDYYIPELNVAIEYDENNHSGYTYEQQEGRQTHIEKELGCRFVRVKDDKPHTYNIGVIIKEMFNINY